MLTLGLGLGLRVPTVLWSFGPMSTPLAQLSFMFVTAVAYICLSNPDPNPNSTAILVHTRHFAPWLLQLPSLCRSVQKLQVIQNSAAHHHEQNSNDLLTSLCPPPPSQLLCFALVVFLYMFSLSTLYIFMLYILFIFLTNTRLIYL